MSDTLALSIKNRFNIIIDPSLILRFHPTGLRYLEYILGLVYSAMHDNPPDSSLYNWLQEIFRDPFASELYDKIASKAYSSHDDLYTDIYAEIVTYVASTLFNITPWDIIRKIANPDGTSILDSFHISNQQIPVQFAVMGDTLPDVYDLTLDEFMGIIAAYPFVGDFSVIIYNITTLASSFKERLEQYLNQTEGKNKLTTTVQSDGGPLDYQFDDITFLSGFITPFSWFEEDHHNSWTTFEQLINGSYETVSF